MPSKIKFGFDMDSKRIRKLKREIIATVPKFPNDKATKSELESKHLADLLIVYLNWAARLITPRPRKVIIEKEATNDNRWNSLSVAFSYLKNKIENGDEFGALGSDHAKWLKTC